MTLAVTDFAVVMPEIFLLTMACLVLVIDVYLPETMRNLTYQLSQGTLIGTVLFIVAMYPSKPVLAMNGMFVSDQMGALLKLFICGIVFMTFIYSRGYLRDRNLLKGEFFVLGLLATLGMMVMVSAHTFLTIYLGLELLSLSMYALVALNRDSAQSSEAAMKYFVLGALASGMLLYGISIIYGVTGQMDLAAVANAIKADHEHHTALVFGVVFIVVGLGFKFGAVPFHMWVPDVYQGAPTPVTLLISSAPKLAAFAMLMRLLVDGMQHLHADWQGMIIVLSVLSMAIGNLVAIAQSNIKRMLAYSTISHVGFLMLGILTATKTGYAAAMFYTIVYTLMSLGGFGVILLLSRAGFEADKLDDFKGLNERNSWFAFIMLILMLSMAGMPPLLGFWAKWAVLSELINSGFMWIAITAVMFSVIGAYYYLRIIKLMYFDKPEDTNPLTADNDMRVALSVNGLAILFLGLVPQGLLTVCLTSLG